VGYNWGFEHYRSVAKNAQPVDESFKDLDISTVQIPDAALETMARLGVKQFPYVTDWSQKVPQLVLPMGSNSGSTSTTSTMAISLRRGDTHLVGKEAPSSSNAPDKP
jgi:hypothetical protein